MLKKVSKVGGSKPTQTKTITKKSSGSSKQTQVKTTTKSSGSSKVSNVYHKPRLIAAATGRDPEPKQAEHMKKVHEQAEREIKAEKFVQSGLGKGLATAIDFYVTKTMLKMPIKPVGTAMTATKESYNVAQATDGGHTVGQEVIYNFLSQPAPQPGNQITTGMPSDEQKFVVQNRNEIDAEKAE